MAEYHCSASIISRGSGQTTLASAAYRSASRLIDDRIGVTFDYKRKGGVAHSDIALPEGAPAWMAQRELLWNHVEQRAKRKDSQLSREWTIALPKELSPSAQKRLCRQIVAEFTALGQAVDWSLHSKRRNPHLHAMTTMAKVGRGGLADKKETAWDKKEYLNAVRERVAELTNEALAGAGRRERVTHLSLAARGIDRPPQPKLGPAAAAMEAKNIPTRVGDLMHAWRVETSPASAWRAKVSAHVNAYTIPVPAYIEGREYLSRKATLNEIEALNRMTYATGVTREAANRGPLQRDAQASARPREPEKEQSPPGLGASGHGQGVGADHVSTTGQRSGASLPGVRDLPHQPEGAGGGAERLHEGTEQGPREGVSGLPPVGDQGQLRTVRSAGGVVLPGGACGSNEHGTVVGGGTTGAGGGGGREKQPGAGHAERQPGGSEAPIGSDTGVGAGEVVSTPRGETPTTGGTPVDPTAGDWGLMFEDVRRRMNELNPMPKAVQPVVPQPQSLPVPPGATKPIEPRNI